jgi:hypothetical protein
LLVLQLDSDRLAGDGLSLAPFASAVSAFCVGAKVMVITATTRDDLQGKLSDLVLGGLAFDVVVVIGHSNFMGMRVAPDRFAEWDEFAKWVKPLHPRRLMLVACQAGRWPAADLLFRKLPKLRRIYASPVNASVHVGQLMLAMLPALVHVKAPRNDVVRAAQAALAAITGVQVRQWVRGQDKDNPEGLFLDFAAQVLDPWVRQLPGALASLFQ